MLTKLKKSLAIALVAAPLSLSVGCAKEEEEEEEEDTAGELAGTWETACITKERDGAVESYHRSRLVITGDQVTRTQVDYAASDTTCAGTPLYTIVEGNTFVVGADVTTPAGAKAFDYTVDSVIATLQTQAVVDNFNGMDDGAGMCGINDWAINVGRDITTASCGGSATDPKMNAPRYDIYDVADADANSLKFGEEDDTHRGYTEAGRPIALSTKDKVYTKVE